MDLFSDSFSPHNSPWSSWDSYRNNNNAASGSHKHFTWLRKDLECIARFRWPKGPGGWGGLSPHVDCVLLKATLKQQMTLVEWRFTSLRQGAIICGFFSLKMSPAQWSSREGQSASFDPNLVQCAVHHCSRGATWVHLITASIRMWRHLFSFSHRIDPELGWSYWNKKWSRCISGCFLPSVCCASFIKGRVYRMKINVF